MIVLDRVSLDIPIINANSFSLKRHLLGTFSKKIHSDGDSRRSVRAIDNISFTALQGEKIALLGRNGAGKSTLLRLLSGIYPPSMGKLTISGSINAMIDIMLGMDEELSGFDNIILKARYRGIPKKELDDFIKDVVDFCELDDFIYLPIKTYSSGMLMRLSFGVATYKSTDILILDEWVSVGDLKFAEKAKKRLDDQIRHASLLIFASHDLDALNAVCSRGLVLESGSIAFDGPVSDAIVFYKSSK
jgi:ABC-type polysaccharide/polyol phosphate transport system ATPase subunit